MQRQSLGGSSPGSKHHHNIIHGGVSSSSKEVSRLFDEEEEAKEETTPTPTRKEKRGVVVVSSDIDQEEEEEEENKSEKHHLRSISRTEKFIHLIPILTIFCLLILYLCSYDPPLKDLAHIDGFRRINSKRIDSQFSSDQLVDDDQNKASDDVLLPMIRSHRSLHEIRKDEGRKSPHRFHRKIGDYYHS